MTTFAKVKDGTVVDLILADQDWVNSQPTENNLEWVETDLDTHNNKHYGADGVPDGGKPFRGQCARIGGVYDKEKDVFYDAKPGIDWTLDEYYIWQPPIPWPDMPMDMASYEWDDNLYHKDKTKGWVEYKTYI